MQLQATPLHMANMYTHMYKCLYSVDRRKEGGYKLDVWTRSHLRAITSHTRSLSTASAFLITPQKGQTKNINKEVEARKKKSEKK